MTSQLSAYIGSLSAEAISNAFIYLIALLFVSSVTMRCVGKYPRFTQGVGNVLTSLGILGTFAGIVVGLMEFNPSNIDGSIESLLAGLKTAFITSLVGMAASIVYKAAIGIIPNKSDQAFKSVGPDEIYEVMSSQLTCSNELLNAIKGDEDASLTSQIKNLRLDINDATKQHTNQYKEQLERADKFQQGLWQKLDEFSQALSKSATEQVINALKEVIVEFNDKLTEQFGENFKRLDESVKKLVDWQENYRVQLEQMATKYQLGVEAISATEQSVASINERAEAIPETMEKLHQVMELGHGQVTELEHRLEGFKELRDKAVEAMPEIKEQLDNTMGAISESVQAASEHYNSMLQESKQVIDHFSETATTSVDSMKSNLLEGAQQLAVDLEKGAHEIGGKLAEASMDIQGNVSTATGGLQNMTNHVSETTEQIKEHLDSAISELNSELRVLVADIKDDTRQTGEVLKGANQDLINSTQQIQSETTRAMTHLHERLETTLQEVFQVQAQAVRRTFDSLEDQISNAVGQTGGAVEKQVEVLDFQLQQEINRTMNEMGEGLASITQQFTRDYQRLVKEMASVVNTRMAS
ncbi:MotA/TolQ/ExbB proton channel family protein [Neiella marina]|uniref:MotA/TolQ/ExbB proton channel family protein n=2 Tax=Neiella holothuriorum TaxID=2870530 RepID=A0ABS7EES6_9GAMM|nr:MotA/TolQ/ExbB proton channel family protein [Neiella holothuriorum]